MSTIAREHNSSGESAGVESPDPIPNVKMAVDDLVAGTRLQGPIYDDKANHLLLAQGSLMTPRFKELLKARAVRDVLLSQADADEMAPRSAAGHLPITAQSESLAQKLDQLIDSGRLFIETAGPKLKERLVLHGCKAYSQGQRDALLAEHAQTCVALDSMIKSASHGEPISGNEITKVVANYLTGMMTDADCVLAVARQARHYAAIAEHCLQMSLFGMALGIELGMNETEVRNIGLSGLLHDWGMSLVPPELLDANRVLTRAEFLEIQKHPIYTLELLKTVAAIPDLVPMICYQIHERPNGTGYPRGRTRSSIHPGARILHVADAFLALTSARPFRKPLMPYAAVECLLRQAAEGLVDGEVVRALLHVVSLFPIGSHVTLSDGSLARVLRRNGNNYRSPIVQIIQEPNGELTDPLDESHIIDPSILNLEIVKAVPANDDDPIERDAKAARVKRD
jgi:HD-GYP domain-containing protein (c-di-GMP phosphodiesterase class II)